MPLSRPVTYLICVSAAAFLLNRHVIRPWVLETVEAGPAVVLVDSLPNLIEAVVGTVLVAGFLLTLRERSARSASQITESRLYLLASAMAGVFVVSQELNWFVLLRHNIYDPFDVTASILGLVVTNRFLTRFGLVETPKNRARSTPN